MAEELVQRRKSTRNRGEPPAKLRKTSPSIDSSPAAATPASRRAADKKTPGKTTPRSTKSTPRTRAKDLSKQITPEPEPESEPEDEDLEPLAQDAMSSLMEKSRQKWLTEGGIFDKFWTKPPRKKKGQPAVDMPSRGQMNMIEIGPVRIIIEPHVFDIHLHGVKKQSLSWQQPTVATPPQKNPYSQQPPPQRTMQNPYPRPGTNSKPPQSTVTPAARGMAPNPYALNQSTPATPGFTSTTTNSQAKVTPQTQPSSVSNTPSATPSAAHGRPASNAQSANPDKASITPANSVPKTAPSPTNAPPAPPSNNAPSAGNTALPAPQGPAHPIQAPTPRAQTARPPIKQQPPPQQPSPPHPDPVIQMLAQRAASDPALKELMKVVAAGSTSPERLKEFQRHIDEINAIVARDKRKREAAAQRQAQQQVKQEHQSNVSTPKQPSQQYRAPPFIASKPHAAPQPARHDFANIVFDFARGGDCYLLPRQSIVQHLPDGMTTLISFIVTKKGKDVPDSALKPETEYFQPMTMTLLTVEQKIRDMISQVVLPKEQVIGEMKEIIERCTLAPSRGMVTSTPNDQDRMDIDSDANKENERTENLVKQEWDPPSFLLPLSNR